MSRCLSVVIILMIVVVCGCGQKDADPWSRVPVRGRVTLDDKPLATGQITFFPVDGTTGPAAGAEIRNGEFSIEEKDGPVAGTHRIEIRSVQKTGRLVASPSAVEGDQVLPEGTMVEEFADVIPTRYNSYSELKEEITEGEANELTFPLFSKEE